MPSQKTHSAEFYVQITRKKHAQYKSGVGYVTASATGLTQGKPSSTAADTVTVKLRVNLPDSAFEPFEPTAVITVDDSQVTHPVHVIVEDA